MQKVDHATVVCWLATYTVFSITKILDTVLHAQVDIHIIKLLTYYLQQLRTANLCITDADSLFLPYIS